MSNRPARAVTGPQSAGSPRTERSRSRATPTSFRSCNVSTSRPARSATVYPCRRSSRHLRRLDSRRIRHRRVPLRWHERAAPHRRRCGHGRDPLERRYAFQRGRTIGLRLHRKRPDRVRHDSRCNRRTAERQLFRVSRRFRRSRRVRPHERRSRMGRAALRLAGRRKSGGRYDADDRQRRQRDRIGRHDAAVRTAGCSVRSIRFTSSPPPTAALSGASTDGLYGNPIAKAIDALGDDVLVRGPFSGSNASLRRVSGVDGSVRWESDVFAARRHRERLSQWRKRHRIPRGGGPMQWDALDATTGSVVWANTAPVRRDRKLLRLERRRARGRRSAVADAARRERIARRARDRRQRHDHHVAARTRRGRISSARCSASTRKPAATSASCCSATGR